MMKKGFTLAEVLITLGVIGVISALTIPNLVTGYQTKVLETQLQRTYNLIKTAVVNSMQDEEITNLQDASWRGSKAEDKKIEFFKKYFETSIMCTKDTGWGNCLADKYYTYKKGAEFNLKGDGTDGIVTQTGGQNKPVCAVLEQGATVCLGNLKFVIDVNGKQSPNQIGKDLFYLEFESNGKTKVGRGSLTASASSGDGKGVNQKDGAAGKYCLTDEKYLKATDCLLYVMSNGWKIK